MSGTGSAGGIGEAEIVAGAPEAAAGGIVASANEMAVAVPQHASPVAPQIPVGGMAIGDVRYGITCTGAPIGTSHYLCDSMSCGDLVMALPSSVLVAGRTKEAGGVAVDMGVFLDGVVEGAARLGGIPGIIEAVGLPAWAVTRMLGTFPALMAVYSESMDLAAHTIEAAVFKASIGMNVKHKRKLVRDSKGGRFGDEHEESEEDLEKQLPPDPSLSKFILTNRMKSRYKEADGVKQAVQVNINGVMANL
jgi:hypothetical protein